MFGAFLAGAADAGSEDLRKRRDHAFALKLMSQKIQMEEESQQRMLDYGGFTEGESKQLGALAGIEVDRPLSVPRAGLLAGLGKANAYASARIGGSRDIDIPGLVETTLDNPELYDTYDARTKARIAPFLAKKGFAYAGKPAGAEREKLIASAMTGLGAIDRINKLFDESKGDYIQYFGPGKLGANKLKAETVLLKDLYEKIQTGAASNSKEDVAYRTLIAPSISEVLEDVSDGEFDGELMKYKLGNIREQLTRIAQNRPTAVVEGRNSRANKIKSGIPVGGVDEKADAQAKALDLLSKKLDQLAGGKK